VHLLILEVMLLINNLIKVMRKIIGMNLQRVTLSLIFLSVKKGMNINLIIMPNIEVNGKVKIDMEQEFKYGQMVLSMMVFGKIIKLTAKVYFGMFMEISMRVNGKEIKLMDKESTRIVMEQPMKDSGKMIYNMEKDKNIGMIAQNIKVIITKVKNME